MPNNIVRGECRPTWSTEDGAIALYLGDARELLPAIEAASIDMLMTDPPYGHNNNHDDLIARRECALGQMKATTKQLQDAGLTRGIANDGAEANDLFRDVLPQFTRVLMPGSCCCCCGGGGGPDPQFARWSLWIDEHLDFKQMVVWDKGPMGMGWHYRRSYETVLVAQKPGAACKWHDATDAVENIIRPGHKGIRKIIPQESDHPTPKPVELAAHFIGLHSVPGDVVLDPFMGRGWVGIACARMDRRFIGVEIDPEHFWAAVERIEAELNRNPLFEDAPKVVQGSLLDERML